MGQGAFLFPIGWRLFCGFFTVGVSKNICAFPICLHCPFAIARRVYNIPWNFPTGFLMFSISFRCCSQGLQGPVCAFPRRSRHTLDFSRFFIPCSNSRNFKSQLLYPLFTHMNYSSPISISCNSPFSH
jgi:hypothetical protein